MIRQIAQRLPLSTRKLSRQLIARGDAARDAGRHAEAAALFEEASRLRPSHAHLRVQCGHMRKESGDLEAALRHYKAACEQLPKDADLALQMGHFYKTFGDIEQAAEEYGRAAALSPDWAEPKTELANLQEQGWSGGGAMPSATDIDYAHPAALDALSSFRGEVLALSRADQIGRLAPNLAPKSPDELLTMHAERIALKRLGRRESGFWGIRRTMRGIEAIHGFAIAREPIVEAQILLDGLAIYRGPVKGGFKVHLERDEQRTRKYVFNIWLDFTRFTRGLHALEIRLFTADGKTRSHHDRIVVADPVAESDYPNSDALVNVDRNDSRLIDEQIRTRPSMVRDARRTLFPNGVRNILVLRTDQLGDMVASVPAMRRLREIAPGARIVGLLTGANAELARTLDLFDEIIVVDFPDDTVERRRLMPIAAQEALRSQLAPYAFDIAMDLAQSNVSRELLMLSGAAFTYGPGGGDWPWLTTDFTFNSHDRWSGLDIVPHSTKVLAMIEALGAALKESAPVIRREDLTREMLTSYGLDVAEDYAVLHMGARIIFSRWPHYAALAAMLLAKTDLKIVMMTEDPAVRATFSPELLASSRVIYLDQRLPFAHFDAFVSFAKVLVGNDSGPKHLASLRGVPAVTLFTARINWTEWGQENLGSIISRKVPCQGCLIFHEADECGKDFTCIADIRTQEVYDAVMKHL
ncbi:ADP-heptose:LPS heptosyltransferase [Sphingomonas zeicaulis]|uniref:glycosyltransferase family 9 protein n=1 Tax=Sphingomonas zeicaulis TaxID=1632740 RepID=UPI003D2138AF